MTDIGDKLRQWDGERMIQIRQIANGWLIEVRGGVGWATLETYAAKDPEGVVEIMAGLMKARVDVSRLP